MVSPKTKLEPIYRFGPFEVDAASGLLRKHGHRLKLANQPLQILLMLLETPGEIVTREQIQQRLWSGDTFVDFENSVNKCVNKLRQSLNDSADKPTFIETLPRRGYRFIGELLPAEAPVSTPPPQAPEASISSAPPAPVRRLSRWIFPIAILLLIGLALLEWRRIRATAAAHGIRSVAVLPLEYSSDAPGQEFVADSLTEELITQLAKSGNFRVISRTSSMQFKGTKKALPQIARELHADAVVEGSVQRSQNHLRVYAQIVLGSTDEQIWAERYDADASDLFAIENRVSNDIAQRLDPVKAKAPAHRNVDPAAHLAYLEGRYYWNQRDLAGFEKARRFFESAVSQQPDYGVAYAGLADTYLLLSGYGYYPQADMIPKAKAAARKALQLEDLAEAHASLALIAQNYDWDWQESERQYRRAIEINPNYPTAHHWYGEAYLATLGRFDEALVQIDLAAELDPLSPIIATDRGAILYFARRYDDAIEQLQRTLDHHPDYESAQSWLARCFEQKREYDKALAALQGKRSSPESLLVLEERARILAEAGRAPEALRISDVIRTASRSQYVDPCFFAAINVGLGRYPEALTELEKSAEEHSVCMVSLRTQPLFDPIRSDPRFLALMHRVHLSQ